MDFSERERVLGRQQVRTSEPHLSVAEHLALQEEEVPSEDIPQPFDAEDVPLQEEVVVLGAADFIMDGNSGGNPETMPIATGIDASRWASGSLVVMLHSATDWAPTYLRIKVYSIAIDPDDPRTIFRGPLNATVEFQQGVVVPPAYDLVALSPPFGDLLQVELEWAQRVDATLPQSFRISVSLLGRRHIFVPELGL